MLPLALALTLDCAGFAAGTAEQPLTRTIATEAASAQNLIPSLIPNGGSSPPPS